MFDFNVLIQYVKNVWNLFLEFLGLKLPEEINEQIESIKVYTRYELLGMSKLEIDELAQEEFNANLDRRKTKERMIDDFMEKQDEFLRSRVMVQ